MNWDMLYALFSALGGIAIVYGAFDAKRKIRERNEAIEASWRARKKEETDEIS